ncbi:hypothetical protein GOODEAATRI_020337, partial [Goodea atripinnis]
KITVDANENNCCGHLGLLLHPALIATIISKQSRARVTLDLMGYEHVDSICFRLMQVSGDTWSTVRLMASN